MKTKKIAAILVCSLLLATLLTGCFPFNIGQIGGADGPTSVIVSSEAPSENSDVSDMPSDVPSEYTSESVEDTQRIGSPETGYVDVPADYVKFINDVNLGEGVVQYSDSTGTNIVTMQYIPNTATNAKSVANGIYNQFKADSEIDSTTLTAATVTLDDTDAYQVYCYSPVYDLYIVSWSFESEYDDYVHYIAVEFTSDNIDLFNMVEDTYHLLY